MPEPTFNVIKRHGFERVAQRRDVLVSPTPAWMNRR
jgi:hypothetical protein